MKEALPGKITVLATLPLIDTEQSLPPGKVKPLGSAGKAGVAWSVNRVVKRPRIQSIPRHGCYHLPDRWFGVWQVKKNPLPKDPRIFHFDQGGLMNKGSRMNMAADRTYGSGILKGFQNNMKTGFIIPNQMGT
ncbi:MAG: hypothetical protein HY892_18775 [Deltaproteobacteria bacterium]|nr:hypothetical protein [Deltaproteobacteria bacterium]